MISYRLDTCVWAADVHDLDLVLLPYFLIQIEIEGVNFDDDFQFQFVSVRYSCWNFVIAQFTLYANRLQANICCFAVRDQFLVRDQANFVINGDLYFTQSSF